MSTDCEDFRICSSMAGRNLPQTASSNRGAARRRFAPPDGAIEIEFEAGATPGRLLKVSARHAGTPNHRRSRPIGVLRRVLENLCLVDAAVIFDSGGAR